MTQQSPPSATAQLAPPRPLRGALFLFLAYGAIALVAFAYLPWAIRSRAGAVAGAKTWCRIVRHLARTLVGIETEVRGIPPTGEVLIASKHQSFLDIILIYGAVPHGKFIMKREILWAPVLGQYALLMGCIPVDRGKRGQAMRRMVADVRAGRADPGQVVIYPQGTRGTAILYAEIGQPCVPVACNVGLFWPRSGVALRPGRAVVEFLEPIPPGLRLAEFMARIEAEIEPASDRLMAEAGLPRR